MVLTTPLCLLPVSNELSFSFSSSCFHHTAFSFANESSIAKSPLYKTDVPQGSLILYLQKGLQYTEVETHINERGETIQCPQPFSIVSKHKCSVKKRKLASSSTNTSVADIDEKITEISDDSVIKLEGHDSEVFICAWHPTKDILASGSGDATARLWQVPKGSSSQAAAATAANGARILRHYAASAKSRDVTTLDWNFDGSLLATASYDGAARIWTADGSKVNDLRGHKGPIFALKWNKSGQYLLSGSFDTTAIIWDANNGSIKQQFSAHSAPTLDVDWRNDQSFASCSTDKHIYVHELGRAAPLKDFAGHTNEVNAIEWDARGRLLASCSDDGTAKLWSCESPTNGPVATFAEHNKEIYTIRWAPCGAGTRNPGARPLLASASFDASIKLWDPDSQRCVSTLLGHRDPVYSVAFSPDGQLIASGSLDKCLNIWSVRDGKLLQRYRGGGGIFEVCWNATGDRVAACFADKSVCVFDVRL